jgi:hypothetical protein
MHLKTLIAQRADLTPKQKTQLLYIFDILTNEELAKKNNFLFFFNDQGRCFCVKKIKTFKRQKGFDGRTFIFRNDEFKQLVVSDNVKDLGVLPCIDLVLPHAKQYICNGFIGFQHKNPDYDDNYEIKNYTSYGHTHATLRKIDAEYMTWYN